jgi:hypothetical protein
MSLNDIHLARPVKVEFPELVKSSAFLNEADYMGIKNGILVTPIDIDDYWASIGNRFFTYRFEHTFLSSEYVPAEALAKFYKKNPLIKVSYGYSNDGYKGWRCLKTVPAVLFEVVGFAYNFANRQFFMDGHYGRTTVFKKATLFEHRDKYFTKPSFDGEPGGSYFERQIITPFIAGQNVVFY